MCKEQLSLIGMRCADFVNPSIIFQMASRLVLVLGNLTMKSTTRCSDFHSGIFKCFNNPLVSSVPLFFLTGIASTNSLYNFPSYLATSSFSSNHGTFWCSQDKQSKLSSVYRAISPSLVLSYQVSNFGIGIITLLCHLLRHILLNSDSLHFLDIS